MPAFMRAFFVAQAFLPVLVAGKVSPHFALVFFNLFGVQFDAQIHPEALATPPGCRF
jgi:hypothetical protein